MLLFFYPKRVPCGEISSDPRITPLSCNSICSSAKPGSGFGASTISGCVSSFFFPLLATPAPAITLLLLGRFWSDVHHTPKPLG